MFWFGFLTGIPTGAFLLALYCVTRSAAGPD